MPRSTAHDFITLKVAQVPSCSSFPGWPETWWEFHKIMPRLANNYRVVAVDLRGMGGSDKPRGGYDKKTMAEDINQLIHSLGLCGRTRYRLDGRLQPGRQPSRGSSQVGRPG